MKNQLLKWVYLKYRPVFYRFFCDEFFSEIPTSVVEPSMKFLSEGRDRLEKWSIWQARMIQSRIVTDPALINEYTGMLMMLKLLLLHTQAPAPKPAQSKKDSEPKRDYVADAEAAVKAIKELSTVKK